MHDLLQVRFPVGYPQDAPELRIPQCTGTRVVCNRYLMCAGLSSEAVSEFLSSLRDEAQKLVGAEMVHVLLQFTEEWLESQNKVDFTELAITLVGSRQLLVLRRLAQKAPLQRARKRYAV